MLFSVASGNHGSYTLNMRTPDWPEPTAETLLSFGQLRRDSVTSLKVSATSKPDSLPCLRARTPSWHDDLHKASLYAFHRSSLNPLNMVFECHAWGAPLCFRRGSRITTHGVMITLANSLFITRPWLQTSCDQGLKMLTTYHFCITKNKRQSTAWALIKPGSAQA